jgi:hypothetical protein
MSLFYGGSSDEEEVEVALVCPVQPLSDLNKVKDVGGAQVFDDRQASDAVVAEKKPSAFKKMRRQFVSETYQCAVALVILVVMLGLVVLSYFYCQVCLFGIVVLSACMCPYISYFNIPLWTSILLIVILGMTYTQRPFTFIWK